MRLSGFRNHFSKGTTFMRVVEKCSALKWKEPVDFLPDENGFKNFSSHKKTPQRNE